MQEEIQTLQEDHKWDIVHCPPGVKLTTLLSYAMMDL